MGKVLKFLIFGSIGIYMGPWLLLFVIIMAVFGISTQPQALLDPTMIGYYYEEQQKYQINWSILAMVDVMEKRDHPTPSSIEEVASHIANLRDKGHLPLHDALASYLNVKDDRVDALLNGANDFVDKYSSMIFNHRFPINITKYYVIQDTFGLVQPPLWTTPHNGVDIAAPQDTKLMAVGTGTVVNINTFGNGGNAVSIQDSSDPNLIYYYAHLHQFAPDLHIGQVVRFNDLIGFVGHTGHATGDHLHFGLYYKGEVQDPTFYLKAWDSMDKYYRRKERNTTWVARLIRNQNPDPRVINSISQAYAQIMIGSQGRADITLDDMLNPYLYEDY